jgi:hypothetical protein
MERAQALYSKQGPAATKPLSLETMPTRSTNSEASNVMQED